MRYGAFLSYAHADARWARWLHRRLESYRVPARLVGTPGPSGPIGARLGTIFRDRDELPTAGDLGATIRAALAESSALIVICSPAAAGSRWVDAEVEAFQALGRGDRIECFIVTGDPGRTDPEHACFPPALIAPDEHGVAHEPLAADARPEGDGRERAFLRLVAGLLGVSYDALARREAQRRSRRLLAITAAAVVGMAIALGLAASAYVARNDAQRRQAQAEDILGFMLGDLREKLTTVGRLDLMRAVDDKATGYFATLNPRDLSDRALEAQARSLTGIGRVRLDEGNHAEAMAAFREAYARSRALAARAPGNGQRLFDQAQAEFWIGFVAYQQARYDQASPWFGRYLDSALALSEFDPDNFDWQREVAYARHNLAVLSEAQGRLDEAEQEMRSKRALYADWMARRPQDLQLRFEAANTASWLGRIALARGHLADAEALYAEQVAGMDRIVTEDAKRVEWQSVLIEALVLLADVQAQRGKLAEARASIVRATPLADGLVRHDPANNGWRVGLGICRWWQAYLAAGADEAGGAAEVAVAVLAQAHAAEPENERILSWLARAHVLGAQRALAQADLADASAQLGSARALLEPAWRQGGSDGVRRWLAHAHLIEGQAALREGDTVRARAAWTAARDLLLTDGQPPFDRLDPLVRALHHLGQDAQAAPFRQRLRDAGYVPLTPFPPVAQVAVH